MIEVVVPSVRQGGPERLVYSLSRSHVRPAVISIISNETQPFETYGLRVRIVRFTSAAYHIGEQDVTLRQNVGLYGAEADEIVIQGDDQIAPADMIGESADVLADQDYFWGNHRLIDFAKHSVDEIVATSPEQGVSREFPTPPAYHGFYSCYGGMFGARTTFIQAVGGFDMAANCHHGNEDQALGYRLMRRAGDEQVMILEPPFSWHGLELKFGEGRSSAPYLPMVTNGCASHSFTRDIRDGVEYETCEHCPHRNLINRDRLFANQPLIAYDHSLVHTSSIWL